MMPRPRPGGVAAIDPAVTQNRHGYALPGELLHLDIRKLGRTGSPGLRVTGDRSQRHRGIGCEYVHQVIDDPSRVAFASIESDERGTSACMALIRAVCDYRNVGVCLERVLTDNGTCCRSRRLQRPPRRLGVRHLRTRPCTLRADGKTERLVQARPARGYARAYDKSGQRAYALHGPLHHYNWHRPHASPGCRPPISRTPLNNVLGLHAEGGRRNVGVLRCRSGTTHYLGAAADVGAGREHRPSAGGRTRGDRQRAPCGGRPARDRRVVAPACLPRPAGVADACRCIRYTCPGWGHGVARAMPGYRSRAAVTSLVCRPRFGRNLCPLALRSPA